MSTDSVINHVASVPPAPGHRISVVRLEGTETLPLTELWAMAGRVAVALRDRGVHPGDRVGVVARNGLEWVLLDLAALRCKVVVAGFEPGSVKPGADLAADYDLRLVFTDEPVTEPGVVPIGEVRSMAEAIEPAAARPAPPVRYEPDEETTLKFTSGSTGRPKGLAATVASIDGSLRAVQRMFAHGAGDDLFVFLPLSLLQQRYWIYSALCFGHDVTVSTYEAAFAALRRTRPTVVMGVPAFYETAMKRIRAKARRATGTDPDEAALAEAARGVFGDRVRYLWTGSAPAGSEMLRFFTAAGLPIYEGYGLNETCIVAKNHPGAHRAGSVGKVVPGKEVLIDADGVISVRSDHPVNRRYAYAAPGESERVFGPDAVVRTGDLGHLDADGFLYIRGRADDVIVLDNARKIVVRPIEEHMRTSPAIEECVIVSVDRAHLVAVVSPASEPADEREIVAQLARTNAVFGRDERIRKAVVARPPFSVHNDTLTSQFKPRRNRIAELYRAEIVDGQKGIHAR